MRSLITGLYFSVRILIVVGSRRVAEAEKLSLPELTYF